MLQSIVVDTLSGLQEAQYMTEEGKPNYDKWTDFGKEIYKFVLALQNLGFETVEVLGYEG